MMIRARGYSFEMTLDAEVTRLRALSRHLEDATPTVLTAMGVQAVSWAVQDFRDKSNGGSAGGVSWKPISLAGARTRLAGRAPYRSDSKSLQGLREAEKPLKEMLRRRLPKGGDRKPNRGAIAADFMRSTPEGKELKSIQKTRQKIKKKRAGQIEREKNSAKVGVDTGRLVNSLVYGVAPLEQAIKVPKGKASDAQREALTRAALDISGNTVADPRRVRSGIRNSRMPDTCSSSRLVDRGPSGSGPPRRIASLMARAPVFAP